MSAHTPPRLTIDTRANGDKDIIVTGGSLHIRVDFDDVDHTAVAREIGLVVDAANSHASLLAQREQLLAALKTVYALASYWAFADEQPMIDARAAIARAEGQQS